MKYIILIIVITLQAFICHGQNIITGKVISNSALEPLQGASISYKGKVLSLTSGDGSFAFKSTESKMVIKISFSGFKNASLEIIDGKLSGYIVALDEDVKTNDEVTVNTGYQELPKERATGSFDKVDTKLFNRVVNPNVLQRLEGLTPGLLYSKLPGGDEINIRGLSTITAGTQPLIVVNNFPYDGDINNINTNDIESITILKDAAAASIWGARSSNGVIVIKLKQGHFNQPLQLSLNSSVTFQNKPRIKDDKNFISSGDYIGVEKYLFNKGFYNNDLSDVFSWPLVSPVVELLAKQRSGSINASQADAEINALAKYDIRDDELKYLYRIGKTQQYSLGITGGGAATNYRFNIGYDENLSNVVGNSRQRLTLSNSTGLKLTTKFNLLIDMNYSSQDANQNGLQNINPSSRFIYPYARLSGDNGEHLVVERNYRESFIDTLGVGLLQDWKYRPLDELQNANNNKKSQDFLIRLKFHYDITRSLSTEYIHTLEKMSSEQNNIYNTETYFARNLINLFSQQTTAGIKYQIPYGGILDKDNAGLTSNSGRIQINFNKKWNSAHTINAIAGSEISEVLSTSSGSRTYGFNNNNLNFANVDYVTNFSLFNNLGNGSSEIPSYPFNLGKLNNRFVSIFGNSAYSYKNKYTISSSVRKDASNLFGVSSNNKWSPFWSIGGGWDISKENFFKSRQIGFLKTRVTYGYNGNINNGVAAIPTIDLLSASTNTTNLPWAGVNNLANKNLRWERSGILNLGVDFKAFRDRVSGSLEYYKKHSIDLISPTLVDPTTGLFIMQLNVASIKTNGFDAKINLIPLDHKLKLETSILFSHVNNIVSKYSNEYSNKSGYVNFGYLITPRKGADPYALMSYKFAGLDSLGNPTGYLNGEISQNYSGIVNNGTYADLVESGSSRPKNYGNIINTISYKGFALGFNISYKFSYYFRRNSINYRSLFYQGVAHTDFNNRWQKPGDEKFTNIPSLIYPDNNYRDIFFTNSEVTVARGDNIRLQDISFSYQTQGKAGAKGLFSKTQFYCYATNLGLLWRAYKYKLDPDYGTALPAPFNISFGFRKNL